MNGTEKPQPGMTKEMADRIAARKAQLGPRGHVIRQHLKDEFHLADIVLIQAMRKFGGKLPSEITSRDPQAAAWGDWLRDMKRAVDAAGGNKPATIPLPPPPTWLIINPGIAALCAKLGVALPGK